MRYIIEDSSLSGIADALRSVKGNQTAQYSIAGMIDEIGTLYSQSGTGTVYSDTLEISEDGTYYPGLYECDAFSSISVSAGYNMAQSIYSDMRNMVGYVVTGDQGDYLWEMLSAQQAISTYSDFHNQIGYLDASRPMSVDTTYYSQVTLPPISAYLGTVYVSENGWYDPSKFWSNRYGFKRIYVSVPGETYSVMYCGYSSNFGVGTMASLAVATKEMLYGDVTFESMSIPDEWFSGITFMGNLTLSGAYPGCSTFVSATVPSLRACSDTHLYSYTFANATIGAISWDSTVTMDGNYVFANCDLLSEVSMPYGSIPHCAFYGCRSLQTVDFGTGTYSISSSAFADCAMLQRVYASNISEVPSHESGVFDDCPSLSAIYVASSMIDTFREQWSEYASLFTC